MRTEGWVGESWMGAVAVWRRGRTMTGDSCGGLWEGLGRRGGQRADSPLNDHRPVGPRECLSCSVE